MSDIDWTKPVEWVASNRTTYPVIASFEQPSDYRLVVIRDNYGKHIALRSNDHTFRNVPEPEPEPPAIDWEKPVEYVFSSDEPPGIVLYSEVDDNGVRHTLIRRTQTGEVVYRTVTSTTFRIFRNVRRKVKHEFWINLYADGTTSTHATRDLADRRASQMTYRKLVECRHIQWEVARDE